MRKGHCGSHGALDIRAGERRGGRRCWSRGDEDRGTEAFPSLSDRDPQSRREGCGQVTYLFKVSEVGLLRFGVPQKWPAVWTEGRHPSRGRIGFAV